MSPTDPPRRRRAWRIVRHVAGALVLVMLLAVLGLLVALRKLDTGLVKGRLRALVRSQAGLELDYGSARADIWKGLALRDVTIASPPEYRGVAPDLLRASRLYLGWSLFGAGPTLRRVTARDVEITVVVDEAGHTSLDTLGHGGAEAAEPAPTPGQALAAFVRGLPDFDRIVVANARVTVLTTRDGKVVTRTSLAGLALDARNRGRGRERHVDLALGDAKQPLAVTARHEAQGAPPGDGAGHLWLDASVDAAAAAVRGAATIDKQTLAAAWPKKGALFDVDASARADGDRLHVALARLDAAAKALDLQGAIVLGPDSLRIDSARGLADLTRLAQLAPGQLPLALREGRLKYDIAGLDVHPAVRLDARGHLDLDGRAAGLVVGHGDDRLALDAVRVTVKGRPLPDGGVQLACDLPAGLLTLEHGKRRLVVTHAESALHASLSPTAPWQGELRTRFDDLAFAAAGRTLHVTRGAFDERVAELRIDLHHPEALSGTIASTATLGSVDATALDRALHGSDVQLVAHGRAVDGVPVALDLDLPIGRFSLAARDAVFVPPGPLHVKARVEHVAVDRAVPLFSTANAHVELALADLSLTADVKKERDAADFKLALTAARAGLLTAFAPPSLALPAKMALTVAANGRLDGLAGAPRLRQHATVHAERPAVTLADETLAATTLDLAVDSDGSLCRQDARATLDARALALDDEALGDGSLAAHATWDADRPSIALALDGRGAALPTGHLAASASFDRKRRVVDYTLDGDVAHLAALEPLLPESLTDAHWIDLSDLHARITSHGQLAGAVARVDRDGLPVLSPAPLAHLVGDDTLHLEVERFHYVDAAGVELTVPSLAMTTEVHAEPGDKRRADVELRIDRATLAARGHRLDVTGLHDVVHASVEGDPVTGPLEVEHRLELAKLGQDVAPLYPIGHVVQTTHARRGADGGFVVDGFSLHNDDGGTTLAMRGGLLLARAIAHKRAAGDAPPIGFSSVTVRYTLEQALDRLRGDPGRFAGAGRVVVGGELASGDLRRYHATADVQLHGATLTLPLAHVRLVGVDGTIPVVEDFVVDHGKTRLFHAQPTNSYGELRFSDQHPFLSRSGALRASELAFGDFALSDVAGNLRLERSEVAVDQLDAVFHHGRVAGQLLVDVRGPQSTLELHLRGSGIEATHAGQKERFDGNAALHVSLAQRSVDGRIEILRIGRHHLYDLLDEYDPHHKDAATNRLRTALQLGFPERANVVFDRGFASLSVAFGGLARLVKVNDVKGIPTGPLVDRYLGPLLSLEAP